MPRARQEPDRPRVASGGVPALSPSAGLLRIAACELLALLAVVPLVAAAAAAPAAEGEGGWAYWWLDGHGWAAAGRSAGLAALAATLAAVLGWWLSAAARRLPRRWGMAVLLLACAAALLPSSVLGAAWIAALARDGAIADAARSAGWAFDDYSFAAAAAAMGIRYAGVAACVMAWMRRRRAGQGRPGGRLDAAVLAWLAIAMLSLGEHVLPEILRVPTCGSEVLMRVEGYLDPPAAAALGVPVGAVGVGALALAALLLRRRRRARPAEAPVPSPPPLPGTAGAALGAALVLAAALAAPLLVLGWRAGSPAALRQAVAGRGDELVETALVAALSGTLCAALAGVLGSYWATRAERRAPSFAPFVLLNAAAPSWLLGVGLLVLMRRPPMAHLRDTRWALVLATALRFLPAGMLLVRMAWNRLRRPGRRWVALAGVWILAVTFAAGESELSLLLAVPGRWTAAAALYHMIHDTAIRVFSAFALGLAAMLAPGLVGVGLLAGWAWAGAGEALETAPRT